MKRFNTSHVTLYQKYPTYETTGGYRFNTSHVTLYHENIDIIPANGYRFNTSHVTLYRTENSMEWNGENSFNTSHVTLYPALLICANCGHSFQYISCYSLSLYFTAFLTPNIFIIPQNTMHCKIFTRRLDNSLFWD